MMTLVRCSTYRSTCRQHSNVCLQVTSTHLSGSVSGRRASRQHSPSLRPFPPPPPQVSPCSAASPVLRAYLTSHRVDGGRTVSLPRPTRQIPRVLMRPPSSCASSFPACSGSPTAQDRCMACDNAIHHVALRLSEQRRHPGQLISRLNGWPAGAPVNASPAASRLPTHDSGIKMFRYSFLASDFHRLLLASLCWRFQ